MRVVDSQVKWTCPACDEAFRLEPADARRFAATMLEAADSCEETMVDALRAEIDGTA
jgi:hypothetical protein